jgi:serine/threonine protein kinase
VSDELTALTAAPDAAEPVRLTSFSAPGFRLQRQIGHGAFGEIWRATQESTGREVAIKFLPARAAGAAREVDKLIRVGEHPHIVTFLDADLTHDPPFLVMPLLEGSLGSILALRRGQPAEPEQALGWMTDVTRALVFIHRRGVLHGDLKPDNILIDGGGRAKLSDFGQAQAFGEGVQMGTLCYMPIDQLRAYYKGHTGGSQTGEFPAAASWDVYALGATFYYVLSGQHPRAPEARLKKLLAIDDLKKRMKSYAGMLAACRLVPLRQLNPKVGVRLAMIVERCLSLEADRQYRSSVKLLEDLELIAETPDDWVDACLYTVRGVLARLGLEWLVSAY